MAVNGISQNVTIDDFDQTAQRLTSIMFVLAERHISGSQSTPNMTNKALSSAALAVQEAINTFVALGKSLK